MTQFDQHECVGRMIKCTQQLCETRATNVQECDSVKSMCIPTQRQREQRVEENRQEWNTHRQIGTEAQKLDDQPRENKRVRDKEEVLPPLRLEQRAARSFESSVGVGIDRFHPKLPLLLTKEGLSIFIDILTKVEQRGCWPEQARTTMFCRLQECRQREADCLRRFGGGSGWEILGCMRGSQAKRSRETLQKVTLVERKERRGKHYG